MSEMTPELIARMTLGEIAARFRVAADFQRAGSAITWEHGSNLVSIVAHHGDLIAKAIEASEQSEPVPGPLDLPGVPWRWERDESPGRVPVTTLRGPDVLCRYWDIGWTGRDAELIRSSPELAHLLEQAFWFVEHYAADDDSGPCGDAAVLRDEITAALAPLRKSPESPDGVETEQTARDRDLLLAALRRLLASTDDGVTWEEQSAAQAQANEAIYECEKP